MRSHRWPWTRLAAADEEATEAKKLLRSLQARQPEVDALTRRAEDIIRRNHLAENIHKALGGHP